MSSLLSGVHRQILAFRLRELIVTSPVVFIYQTLGGKVHSGQLEASLQAALNKALPGDNSIRPVSFKVKNTVAAAVDGGALAPLFHTSNILVGWHHPPPPASPPPSTADRNQDAASPLAERRIMPSTAQPPVPSSLTRRDMSLADVLAGAGALAAGHSARWPPQSTMSVLLRLALSLQEQHPIALMACLHRGQPVKVSQLERWASLDHHTVFSELLMQLDTPAAGLLSDLTTAPEHLTAALDGAQPQDLLACLDARS